MPAWTAAWVLCCTFAIALLRGQCTNAHPLADSTLPLSEVIWRPEADGIFVGSPSIVALSNGSLVASHDDFGPNAVSCSLGRRLPASKRVQTQQDGVFDH